MPIKTRRWNDPASRDDGHRLLVCRYRPRALPRADETWDAWQPDLGPSRALHARYYHGQPPPTWAEYRRRYLAEMRGRAAEIDALAARVAAGETVTLLCSSACVDPQRCHRTLLASLISQAVLDYRADGRATRRPSHRAPAGARAGTPARDRLPGAAQGVPGRPRVAARARR